MAEVKSETDYVPHHKKKIAFIFSAMRHFASLLRQQNWTIDYVPLDAVTNLGTLTAEIDRAAAKHCCARIICTEPGEWRLKNAFEKLANSHTLPVEILQDKRFLCSNEEFVSWWQGRRQPRMEHFYRKMRRHTGLLMDENKPVGRRWNFDSENRKAPRAGMVFPTPCYFTPDQTTSEVLTLVDAYFPNNFGSLEPFWFGVTHADAEAAFDRFIAKALPYFGDFQDAMVQRSSFLFHAVISLYLNIGLLDPRKVCTRVETAYRAGVIPVHSSNYRMERICSWCLLAGDAELLGAKPFWKHGTTTQFLLDRRHGHGLPARLHYADAGGSLRAPYPTINGNRQFRHARRYRPESSTRMVSRSLRRRL